MKKITKNYVKNKKLEKFEFFLRFFSNLKIFQDFFTKT